MDDKNKKDIDNKQEKVKHFPKYDKYLTLVDRDTGEVKGHIPLKSKGLGTGWIGLYQEAADMLAEWKLTTEQYRVFLKLLAKLDFDNYLKISHTGMAEELTMKRSAVSRAMKALEDLNVIMEGPRAGLNKTYRLNPYIAHKGRNRDSTIKDTGFGEGLTLIRGGKDK